METKDTRKSGMSDTIGILMTIAGGCLWGLSAACGQFLFDVKGATAKWMVPIRLILAGSLMLFYYIIREKKEAFRIWKKKRDAIDVMIYGLAGLMLCQFTYYYTIELSNAGTATVLQYISPVLIMILVCISEKRIPKIMEVVALVLAVLGIFLIATHGDINHLAISKEALAIGLFDPALRGKFINIGNSALGGAIKFLDNPKAIEHVNNVATFCKTIDLTRSEEFNRKFVEYMNFN